MRRNNVLYTLLLLLLLLIIMIGAAVVPTCAAATSYCSIITEGVRDARRELLSHRPECRRVTPDPQPPPGRAAQHRCTLALCTGLSRSLLLLLLLFLDGVFVVIAVFVLDRVEKQPCGPKQAPRKGVPPVQQRSHLAPPCQCGQRHPRLSLRLPLLLMLLELAPSAASSDGILGGGAAGKSWGLGVAEAPEKREELRRSQPALLYTIIILPMTFTVVVVGSHQWSEAEPESNLHRPEVRCVVGRAPNAARDSRGSRKRWQRR